MRAEVVSIISIAVFLGCGPGQGDGKDSSLGTAEEAMCAEPPCGKPPSCEDPPCPKPTPRPTPKPTPPPCSASYPSLASGKPYATDQATWLRWANRYGARQMYPGAFVNFHQADYGQGTVYGTFVLKPGSVALGRDVPRTDLGSPALEDVPAMMRQSQLYARSQGYPAALPTFEQAMYNGVVVYGVGLLASAAVEVRDIHRCELGYVDPGDVSAMFRTVNNYAVRAGYAGGFPTFETSTVDRIVLFRPGTTIWRDVPEHEISEACGQASQHPCSSGCAAGLELFHATGTWWQPFDEWFCAKKVEVPRCGQLYGFCCGGNSCDPGLTCYAKTIFDDGRCAVPQTPPPPPRCGDGVCNILGGTEGCDCDDCKGTFSCASQCPSGQTAGVFDFCATCPGYYTYQATQTACSSDLARQAVQAMYANCTLISGQASGFELCVTCPGQSPSSIAQVACTQGDAKNFVVSQLPSCAVVEGPCR